MSRCPTCRVALRSTNSGAGDLRRFVRAGALLEPDRLPPDGRILTSSKRPWVVLPAVTPAVPEYYGFNDCWLEESLRRRHELVEEYEVG